MIAAESCMWPRPLIRLRDGPRGNWGEAFPWDSAPRFLLRDRDGIFEADFTKQVKQLGVPGAPGVPQQRVYIERVIGTIRRDCLDHVVAFNEATLCRHLKLFLA